MVGLLLELSAPAERLWIIGQPANVAARDVAHLLTRVVMLVASMVCW